MNCKRKIGLHLRAKNSISTVLPQAEKYNLNLFQCFLNDPVTKDYYTIEQTDKDQFSKYKEARNAEFYVHSSYWINPSSVDSKIFQLSEKILKRELHSANFLGAKELIIHPGCAKGHERTPQDPLGKIAGINKLVSLLNNLTKEDVLVDLLLENTAHANQSIGSNLSDFPLIMEKIKTPEKINFCLDLAHAFAYGYNLKKADEFIDILDKNIGLSRINLLHLSDTSAPLGSKIDIHKVPGTGNIGKTILSNIINHPALQHIPIIIELPTTVQEQEFGKILENVKNW